MANNNGWIAHDELLTPEEYRRQDKVSGLRKAFTRTEKIRGDANDDGNIEPGEQVEVQKKVSTARYRRYVQNKLEHARAIEELRAPKRKRELEERTWDREGRWHEDELSNRNADRQNDILRQQTANQGHLESTKESTATQRYLAHIHEMQQQLEAKRARLAELRELKALQRK
jgi:hypothetical protein